MKIKLILAMLLAITVLGCSGSEDTEKLMAIDRQMNNGQYAFAVQESEKYVKDYPESCRGWTIMGWAYQNAGQVEKAEKCFDKAISIDDKWDNAHVGKGVLYRQQGKLDLARQSYQKAIALVPGNAEAFSSLVVIELMEGNDRKAVEYGEKAWALRRDYPSIPANLAIAYHYLGDYKRRDEFYEHAKRVGYHNLQAIQDVFSGKTSIR